VVEVPLTQGKVAIIDAEDAPRVLSLKWYAMKCGDNRYYARTAIRTGSRKRNKYVAILLHRLILSAPPGVDVDHKDGNGLNCRRENLRLANRYQNAQKSKIHSDNTSGFKGVHNGGFFWSQTFPMKMCPWWRASITVNGRVIPLGCFKTKEAAAVAYDRAAIHYFGEFARINGVAGNPDGHRLAGAVIP
jgi:hypothetical protein